MKDNEGQRENLGGRKIGMTRIDIRQTGMGEKVLHTNVLRLFRSKVRPP
jgi:hypothetical protein